MPGQKSRTNYRVSLQGRTRPEAEYAIPAQKRNGLPKRKSATRTKISGPGPISLVIMVPRTEIPAVFSGDFGPADQNHPDQNRCDRTQARSQALDWRLEGGGGGPKMAIFAQLAG